MLRCSSSVEALCELLLAHEGAGDGDASFCRRPTERRQLLQQLSSVSGAEESTTGRTLLELLQEIVQRSLLAARKHRPRVILHLLVLNHSSNPQAVVGVDVNYREGNGAELGDGLGRRERPLAALILGDEGTERGKEVGSVEAGLNRLELERRLRLGLEASVIGDLGLVLDCRGGGSRSVFAARLK